MDFDAGVARSRRTIGFGLPSIRMEEEDDQDSSADHLRRGQAEGLPSSLEAISAMIDRLLDERSQIIELLKAKQVEKVEALTLLADNRQLILFLQGGSPYRFATEKVIYGLLIFSGIVILLLAGLHALGKLDAAVMTTFVGTTVGGTLATIAQKLGKVGR